VYKAHKGGGQIREYEEEARGDNLVRLATEDEVIPNEVYYIKDPLYNNRYLQTTFHPEVNWTTILEFIQTQKLYVRTKKANQDSDSQPPRSNGSGVVQSSLF
jgi:hypothetical protein